MLPRAEILGPSVTRPLHFSSRGFIHHWRFQHHQRLVYSHLTDAVYLGLEVGDWSQVEDHGNLQRRAIVRLFIPSSLTLEAHTCCCSACAASIVRLVFTVQTVNDLDFTWSRIPLILWTYVYPTISSNSNLRLHQHG